MNARNQEALAALVVRTERVECDKCPQIIYKHGEPKPDRMIDIDCSHCHGSGEVERQVPGVLLDALIQAADESCNFCSIYKGDWRTCKHPTCRWIEYGHTIATARKLAGLEGK